jgi:phage baseplate assembly protein W
MEEIYGQDIKLDENMQALVAANGELLLTDGPETGSQDIKLRLFTPLHELFYDKDFGSLLHQWIQEENTLTTRMAFEAEVLRRVRIDSRVVVGSESCTILAWDNQGIKASVSWQFIDTTHPFNLVLEVGTDKEMVIKDVNPNQ